MRVGCVGIRIGGLRSPARGHNGSVFRCIRKREKTEGAKKKNGPPSAAGRVRPKNRCSAHLQGAKKMSLFTAAVCAAVNNHTSTVAFDGAAAVGVMSAGRRGRTEDGSVAGATDGRCAGDPQPTVPGHRPLPGPSARSY